MATRPTYEAIAIRSGGWWAIEVPQVRGVHSQARRLDQAEDIAREAIALMLEVPEDSFDVELKPELAGPAADDLSAALAARGLVERAQADARASTIRAAQRLHVDGLPVRDIGALLGLSHQRVAKLLSESAGPPEVVGPRRGQ